MHHLILRFQYTWFSVLASEMHLRAARCHWRKHLKRAQQLQRWEQVYQGKQEAALNALLMAPPPGPTSVAVSWVTFSVAVVLATFLFVFWVRASL